MLPARWHKVIHDLWDHRTRTLVVALAVAVGVYAVGAVLSTQTVMLREFHADRNQAALSHATIRTEPFDQELAERMSQIPGVAAAEGRRSFAARVITGPTTTRDIRLEAMADFDDQQVDRYLWVEGAWPTQKDEAMLEWNALEYLGVQIGDTITVELGDNTRKTLTISGTAHNPNYPSPDVVGFTLAAISPETLRYLGQSDLYTELRLRLTMDDPDRETVRAVTSLVEDQFENSGRTVAGTTITGESVIESIVNTAVLILSTFGWIILLLSAFLVVNTITALIAQQTNQIGIMKLVRGRTRSDHDDVYRAGFGLWGDRLCHRYPSGGRHHVPADDKTHRRAGQHPYRQLCRASMGSCDHDCGGAVDPGDRRAVAGLARYAGHHRCGAKRHRHQCQPRPQ